MYNLMRITVFFWIEILLFNPAKSEIDALLSQTYLCVNEYEKLDWNTNPVYH